MIIPGGIIGGVPKVTAVDYNGSSYISATSITGIADGGQGAISFWINLSSDTATPYFINVGNFFTVWRIPPSSGIVANRRKLNINGLSSAGSTRINYISGTAISTGSWLNILASWNTGTGASECYFNDVADGPVTDTVTAGDIDYTRTVNQIGAQTSSGSFFNGDMSEFWFNTSYIDFSVQANRRKFIKADGSPQYLGRNGERPTGSSPLLYFQGPAANWGTNSGTGGNFTVTGTFTDAPPPP